MREEIFEQELIDLGAASVETKGEPAGFSDDQGGPRRQLIPALLDD